MCQLMLSAQLGYIWFGMLANIKLISLVISSVISALLYQLCYISSVISALLYQLSYISSVISAQLYQLSYISSVISAMLYQLCYISYVISAQLYTVCTERFFYSYLFLSYFMFCRCSGAFDSSWSIKLYLLT